MRKNKAKLIKERFLKAYPNAKTELKYSNLYELLVCVMLSAQCTDKRVNLITPAFFERFPDIQSLANGTLEEIRELIKSCSYFNNKAKHLKQMAEMVVKEFDGEIPSTFEELKSLPGVGQKTANVILVEYFNDNKIPVDTHVFRVSHRLGISKAKTPEKTELDLFNFFRSDLGALHHAMVLFGRYVCLARNPKCNECFLNDICKSKR